MNRSEKYKHLHELCKADETKVAKIKQAYEYLHEFSKVLMRGESTDAIFNKFYSTFGNNEDNLRSFVNASYYINDDAKPSDVLAAYETILRSKNV